MSRVVLKSGLLRVVKKRKTTAKFWKDIDVGDKISFSFTVSGHGTGRHMNAVYMTVENLTKSDEIYDTLNRLVRNMDGFEFEEVKNND